MKGHATGDMVVSWQFRALDKAGNGADDAADFGGRRVLVVLTDSWRHFAGLCNLWFLVVSGFHQFLVAIARVALSEDGAGRTAVDTGFGLLCLFLRRRRLRWR